MHCDIPLEGIDTIRNMTGHVNWVWVDCFTRMPLTAEDYQELKGLGYKLCLVSPELEGRPQEIEEYRDQIKDAGFNFDAICGKIQNIGRWGF